MRARRTRGFTLLETLIAFVIAALALAVLIDGATTGLRAASVAAGYEQAVSRAKSYLASTALAPAPGDQTGDDGGGYRWHTRVRLLDKQASGPQPGQAALGLFEITVWIAWTADGKERQIRLTTQRVGPAA